MTPRILSVVVCALLGLGAASSQAGLTPDGWGGRVGYGHDSNVLSSSQGERDAFDSGASGYWFQVDRLEDWRANLELWGEWKVKTFAKGMKAELGYRRSQYAHLPILRSDRFDLSLKQKLTKIDVLSLALTYEPQVYLRHRLDKDAPPGAPLFRPESYRGIGVEVAYARPTLAGRTTTVFSSFESQDESRWFNERDRKRVGVGASMVVPFGPWSFTPSYEFAGAASRNEPDLGSDFGYREHVVGLRTRLTLGGGTAELPTRSWVLGIDGRAKLRGFTTDNPDDTSRYQRDDVSYSFSGRLLWRRGALSPFIGAEYAGRNITLPAGADGSDEEGEYEDGAIGLGLEWEY
ncbi:MAG: hypothetical protein IPK72_00265 [Candidatus Eisenbacteria bacterium]|nr:hypothetical protein [Candidatus Eisenbacteria bacterium]